MNPYLIHWIMFGVLASVLAVQPAWGTTYFVWGDRGNDRNSGQSWELAWKSIRHAGEIAQSGDTVVIKKSEVPYRYLRISRSGTESNPIIFRGESADNRPVLIGAERVSKWHKTSRDNVWSSPAKRKPSIAIEDDKPIEKASSPHCLDGQWFWNEGLFYYRPTRTSPFEHEVWRQSYGGGIVVGSHSWIEIENLTCWIGGGACVQITGGHNNVIRNVHSKWNWRGVDITEGGHHNLVEKVTVEEAREGMYIRNGASYNTIRNCTALRNGNPPLWTTGDRHAIAVGEQGGTVGNVVEHCEIAYNGGIDDTISLGCFRSPKTVLRNNYIHDNYGTGIGVYFGSHGSVVEGNKVIGNGKLAVQSGAKGVTGITIRNSRNVSVIGNHVENNHVSPDSRWKNQYIGPHGGLDIDSTSQRTPTDMSGLRLINNVIKGTVGGPDIHISRRPQLTDIAIIPKTQAPSWLRVVPPAGSIR